MYMTKHGNANDKSHMVKPLEYFCPKCNKTTSYCILPGFNIQCPFCIIKGFIIDRIVRIKEVTNG